MQQFDNYFNRSKFKGPKENAGRSVIYNLYFTKWQVFALKQV